MKLALLFWFAFCFYNVVADLPDDLKKFDDYIQSIRKDLDETRSTLATTIQNLFPIGYLYIEFPHQTGPNTIFKDMNWTDVTSEYAGLFFRAEGKGSAQWEQDQVENVPQITKVHHLFASNHNNASDPDIKEDDPNYITMDKEQSDLLFTGWGMFNDKERAGAEAIQFDKTFGEVRPRNTAIRIWKRTK